MRIENFLNESPIFASIVLYDRLVRRTSEKLKDENLGVIDALILVAIAMEKDKDVTPGMLSRSFRVKASNLSHSIGYLVGHQLVTREVPISDQRNWILKPTTEGRKTVNRLIKFFDKDQEHLERILGLSGIKLLGKTIQKLDSSI